MSIRLFEVIVLSAHLLAVGVATAAPFVCVLCDWRARRGGDAALARVGRRLAGDCLWLFLVGVALGFIQLAWLLWRGAPADIEALRTMPVSRWWFGGAELLIYLACMLAYWYGYDRWQRRGWHRLLAIVAGTNLGYHFPALFTIVSVVGQRSELWGTTINFRELLTDRETIARVLHFWLASFAVTGVLAMRPWRRAHVAVDDLATAPVDQHSTSFGAWVALVAMGLQMPLGLWLLTTLPTASQHLLMGRSAIATGLLIAAVVASLALLHLLASMTLGQVESRLVRRSAALVIGIVTLMVATRLSIRDQHRHEHQARRPHLPEACRPVTLRTENLARGSRPLSASNRSVD
ncbi:MAG: hypothetical protein K2Y37_07380 [Pirellulales bacterium]|nr:hypothetical protein [Pirellulales bacterium]